MRVEQAQVPAQGGLKVKTGAGPFTASLKEGDSLKAEVLSSEKGAVVLKAEGGQIFKAKLDSDVTLLTGDKVLLEVTGKEAGIVTLSVREEAAEGEKAGQPGFMRGISDETLFPYASKLAELNMPVTEENARTMRELISQNPKMSLEEAAFIASNKLAGDESLIKAAISILSDGEKTAAMLERLMTLLNTSSNSEAVQGREWSVASGQWSEDGGHVGRGVLDAPLGEITDFLALVDRGETDAAGAVLRGEPILSTTTSEIIPQSDATLQSSFFINDEEMLKTSISSVETTVNEGSVVSSQWSEDGGREGSVVSSQWSEDGGREGSVVSSQRSEDGGHEGSVVSSQRSEDGGHEGSVVSGQRSVDGGHVGRGILDAPPINGESIDPELTAKSIAGILSELQEFSGTPADALERFSNMLLKVGGGSAGNPSDNVEKLADILGKMFTRIEKNDKDAGMRLKNAKEELFARLALLEETISRAEPQAKTQMLDQTRRLMDHVRLLNNIDQFAYLQLPVQIGEERKTAELYLFKKKGGKKLDPENVNILLALDLENMGHWEGLINFKNKDVSIKMEVAGPKEKEHFSENTVLLHDLLAEAGFKLVNTDIAYAQMETTPLTALNVLSRHTARTGSVDFTV